MGRNRARELLLQVSLAADKACLKRMIPLVPQVMHQTRERIFKGNTHVPGKLVRLFARRCKEGLTRSQAAEPAPSFR
jgi:transposase, IS5 family